MLLNVMIYLILVLIMLITIYTGCFMCSKPNKEAMENTNNTDTNKCCDNLIDNKTLGTIQENTKNINELRTMMKNIDPDALLNINNRINSLDELIDNNDSDLKDISQQKMDNINSMLGVNIQSDGSIYGVDGKPIYKEKQ